MKESVSPNHPFHRLKRKWAQKAQKRMEAKGTVGSMTRLANAAGESTREFAVSHYHSPGKVGEKARYAANLNHWR